MKKIMKVPIPRVEVFRIPKDISAFVKARRWQIQWRPFGYDGETQILNIYFNCFGIRIEIKWRLLMLNGKRSVREILPETSRWPLSAAVAYGLANHLSKLEKERWYITLV